jgi:calcium-dependent protein kinase
MHGSGNLGSSGSAENQEQLKFSSTSMRKVNNYAVEKDYIFLSAIGSGETGRIWSAEHRKNHLQRAIKQFVVDSTNINESSGGALLDEISVLRSLNHPHIVRLYEVYHSGCTVSMVMELCTGGRLIDYLLKKKTVSEPLIARIMSQLLSAITYCHSRGVLHKGIEIENILIEKSMSRNLDNIYTKLIDFGCAALENSASQNSQQISTKLCYVAPEGLNGKFGKKSDVWSCGIVMHILLAGTVPFASGDVNVLKRDIKGKAINFR